MDVGPLQRWKAGDTEEARKRGRSSPQRQHAEVVNGDCTAGVSPGAYDVVDTKEGKVRYRYDGLKEFRFGDPNYPNPVDPRKVEQLLDVRRVWIIEVYALQERR